jgi:hypothetical protein
MHPKKLATRAMMAGAVGVTAAQGATHTGVLALMMGAAGAASATGIGLAAVGGALTVGGMALGAASAYSTKKHLDLLEEIYRNRNNIPQCEILALRRRADGVHHLYIANVILPWIIRQKKLKFGKKLASAGGLGLVMSAGSAVRKAYKWGKGNLGKDRSSYADILARHLLTHECDLTKQIVEALCGQQKLQEFLNQDTDTVAPQIAEKMKSV